MIKEIKVRLTEQDIRKAILSRVHTVADVATDMFTDDDVQFKVDIDAEGNIYNLEATLTKSTIG